MARKTWIIKGKLKLMDLPAAYRNGETSLPLASAKIRISANEGVRWKNWGTVTTLSDGSFIMRKKKDRTRRKIRIEVQFKNHNTVVYGENSSLLAKAIATLRPVHSITSVSRNLLDALLTHATRAKYKADFHKLRESNNRTTGGGDYEFDYGNINIRSNSDGYLYEHACIYYGCEQLRTHLSRMNQPFEKKLAVKYPHNNKLINDSIETAYCSPLNNCVYLIRNSQRDNLIRDNVVSFNTLYHELMHLWAYGYSQGEDSLAVQLIIHGSTHDGLQAKTYTAFHEAWAEVSSNHMLTALYNEQSDIYGGNDYEVFPFHKPTLQALEITDLTNIDRHEYGWMHIFNTLMCDNLTNFNTSLQFQPRSLYAQVDNNDRDNIPSLDIYDIMQAFKMPLPFYKNDMNLNGFMDRIQEVEPEINDTIREGYMKVFDVSDDTHPQDCF